MNPGHLGFRDPGAADHAVGFSRSREHGHEAGASGCAERDGPGGTHLDFYGLPPGEWRIKIFTVSGDLVAELNAKDSVNESVRGEATDSQGVRHPGYNRQQDTIDDGQARWNLISRNGQDVVSGIYLYTVELGGEVVYRSKFVVIR